VIASACPSGAASCHPRPRTVLTGAAADLLRPSAEEASPDDQTSGALCRRTVLAERSHSHARHSSPHRRPRMTGIIRGDRPARPRALHGEVKAMRARNQDAFRWIDLRPRDRSRLARAPFDVRPRSPRTLSPTAIRSPSSSGNRRVKLTQAGVTTPKVRIPCRGRCVSPTSATDLRHEHPRDRSTLESPPPLLSRGMAASMPLTRA